MAFHCNARVLTDALTVLYFCNVKALLIAIGHRSARFDACKNIMAHRILIFDNATLMHYLLYDRSIAAMLSSNRDKERTRERERVERVEIYYVAVIIPGKYLTETRILGDRK